MDVGELLTTDEMAKRIRVRPDTLRRFVRDGIIPAVRLSSKVIRFDPEQVASFLRGRSLPDSEATVPA